ncbi:MAG: YceI family protein [Desulfobulbaceae bacterium]|nr:YceI family protein [Desulfobulbaceae bacterium]
MKKFIGALFFGLFWLFASPAVSAENWLIDIDHSAAHFSIKHMTIAKVRGDFADLTGTATIDDKNGKLLGLQIKVGVASIDTGVVKRDDHLRSADFFDVGNYPTMTFVSKEIHEGQNGPTRIVGSLTIKGITRETSLDLQGPTGSITDPWGNLRKGATLTTTINRNDFGITYNKVIENVGLIGNTVEIETDLEFLILKPAK